jgi:hypothetical protein
MILIEPTDISFGEIIADCQNSLTFKLGGPPWMDKVTIDVVALLTLANKIAQILSGMSFGNASEGVIKAFRR